MSKKFISFLGTGPYKKCKYQFENQISEEVIFIQEVLIKEICSNFSPNDKILIFLDNGSKIANWDELLSTLQKLHLKCEVRKVDIDEKAKRNIWEIFNLIYSRVNEKDELYFDVTHSFRYLPMICFSVLSYAKYLKNTTVNGIYYGAFELRDIDNISPIINLTDCYNIMEWANAADLFTNYGITNKLKILVDKNSEFSSQDNTRKLVFNINSISKIMNCNRGQKIIEANMFKSCYKQIDGISKENVLPVFNPILEKVQTKIKGFNLNDTTNFLSAVRWYLNHDMIPQGITMLQEGLVTWILAKHNLDFKERNLRETLSAVLSRRFDNKTKWNPPRFYHDYKIQIDEIMEDESFTLFCPIYKKITEIRNDVNHGGFRKNSYSPELIKEKLEASYEEIKSIIKNNQ